MANITTSHVTWRAGFLQLTEDLGFLLGLCVAVNPPARQADRTGDNATLPKLRHSRLNNVKRHKSRRPFTRLAY